MHGQTAMHVDDAMVYRNGHWQFLLQAKSALLLEQARAMTSGFFNSIEYKKDQERAVEKTANELLSKWKEGSAR